MPMPVTVVVSRRARSRSAGELTEWGERLCCDAAGFPGYLGCKVTPVAVEDSVEVMIGLSFSDIDSLARWERSEERAMRLAAGARLTEGTPTPLSIESLGGLWFADNDHQRAARLPRWLSATLVWLSLFPPALGLNMVLGPYLRDWPVVIRTLATTLMLVPLVFYVTLPLLHRAVLPLLPDRRQE